MKDAEHSVDIHELLADAKLSYNKLGDPLRTNAFPSLPHVSLSVFCHVGSLHTQHTPIDTHINTLLVVFFI